MLILVSNYDCGVAIQRSGESKELDLGHKFHVVLGTNNYITFSIICMHSYTDSVINRSKHAII